MNGSISQSPLVSIAVNNYNYESYLHEAIDSALAQSYPHVEVIVVDDGSTDGSRGIIAGYGDRIYSVLKENGGQASAFNAGFAACSGEIVIFLDADDALDTGAVRRVVECWRPGLAKIQYLLEVTDGEGRRQGTFKPKSDRMPSGDLRSLILSTGMNYSSPTSGNAFAREVLEELLPMPEKEWRISADGYLMNLAPFLGDVLSLHEKLGLYRVHASNNWAMQSLDLRKIRKYLAHDIQKQELLQEFGRREGLVVDENLVLRIPSHVRARFASLTMEPELHPYPEDSAFYLASRGAAGCWRSPEFSLRKKILYSSWFVLLAVSPRRVSRLLIRAVLMPAGRRRLANILSYKKGMA